MAKPVKKQEDEGLFAGREKRNVILCLLIAVATLALYNPVNRHPFVNYDDDRYVTENPHVHNGLRWDTVTWALTATEQANWHPLTWLSHALDYDLFRLNAGGHHFTSLLIHASNAMLLFLILAWATDRTGPSLFVALLFAVHPMNVESVAWVAERKNVLSTFFFLLTLVAYGWHVRKPGWKRYLVVAVAFVFGLMAKPMVVTLPFVLLLADYWPLNRVQGTPVRAEVRQFPFSKLLLEKIPLLLLSGASAYITVLAQQAGGAMRSTAQIPFVLRLQNALVAYAMYLWKMVWPARLAPVYPHPDSLGAWQVAAAMLLLGSITGLALALRPQRYLLIGWLWFLGTLVPVIGLVQVGDTAMADRFGYIPLIGIFVMIGWGAVDLCQRYHVGPSMLAAPAVCVLVTLGFATNTQLSYWNSNYELWSHTLAVTGSNFIAEDNLGGSLVLLGRTSEACPHFQAAAAIRPQDPLSHFNMGACFQDGENFPQAIVQYQATIRLTSDRMLLASAYANQGGAYRDLGDTGRATESYNQALRLNPDQFNAYLGLGRLLEREGKLDEAIRNYSRSVELRPTDDGFFYLGHAWEIRGSTQQALAAYQEALKLAPERKDIQQAVDALNGGNH